MNKHRLALGTAAAVAVVGAAAAASFTAGLDRAWFKSWLPARALPASPLPSPPIGDDGPLRVHVQVLFTSHGHRISQVLARLARP